MINSLKLDILPDKFDDESSWIAGVDEDNQNIINKIKKEYQEEEVYEKTEQLDIITHDSDKIKLLHKNPDIPNSAVKEEFLIETVMKDNSEQKMVIKQAKLTQLTSRVKLQNQVHNNKIMIIPPQVNR